MNTLRQHHPADLILLNSDPMDIDREALKAIGKQNPERMQRLAKTAVDIHMACMEQAEIWNGDVIVPPGVISPITIGETASMLGVYRSMVGMIILDAAEGKAIGQLNPERSESSMPGIPCTNRTTAILTV